MKHEGRDRKPGRVGKLYLLLSVFDTASALVLARRFDLDVATTAVTVLLGLAPAYLAWAGFRFDRAETDPVDVDKVVNELAMAVKNQWDSEAAVRRINDPYPLPVAWRAAHKDLAEQWSELVDRARRWPGGPPGDPGLWPSDASGLKGSYGEIGQVFLERVPTRRLLILGERGSGKSMLLIRLLQDLIVRREDGDPVPVLFSMASWDPHRPLKTWMADQLRRTHPGLTAAAPSSVMLTDTAANGPSDLALYLLNAGRILPLLDGFDELPPTQHATALDLLNRALPDRQPLVLTSRTTPYRKALHREDTTVLLNGAAAIQLRPLDAQAAAGYLRRDAGGPHTPAAARWATVVTHLGTKHPVGRALSTPLGLFLARTIYNPRPGAPPGSPPAPHPNELCTAAYPDRAAIDTHLFRAFIPAAYTPHQPHPPRWTAEQAHGTFVFLAAFLHNQQKEGERDSPNLAWWDLTTVIPRHIRRLVFGITVSLVVGLVFGFVAGLTAGLAIGSAVGLAVEIADSVTPDVFDKMNKSRSGKWILSRLAAAPPEDGKWPRSSSPRLATGLAFGLVFGLVVGLVVGLAVGVAVKIVSGLVFALEVGGAIGFAIGLIVGSAVWLAVGIPDSVTPGIRLRFSPSRLANGFVFGITTGLVLGVAFDIALDSATGLVIGAAAGIGTGLAAALLPGFTADKPDLTTSFGPITLHTLDRRAFLTAGLVAGPTLGLTVGPTLGLSVGLVFGPTLGLIAGIAAGGATGIVAGIAAGLWDTAWGYFAASRAYLTVRHNIPWDLMAFLQDAHEQRGVLRQAGAVYQFRHIELQRHLAQHQNE
jgi:hypothetical protein